MKSFKDVKKKFKNTFHNILKTTQNYELDEAAFPAYAHKNILIDHLFWKRVQVAFNYSQKNSGTKKALDFGCGSGVLSYLLAKNGYNVTGVDIEFRPLELIREKVNFPSNIEFIKGDILALNLPQKSYDVIFALDVLEHIENLQDYIDCFKGLLAEDGVIIISGPTENILYKIGRKIAGQRFTGDYHVTNISKIKNEFKQKLEVKTIKKLVFPLVLFELFEARKSK